MKINTKNGFLNKNGFNSSSDVCCHLTPCQYHCTTYKHSEGRFFTAYPNTHMHTNVPPHIHQSTSAVIELPSGGKRIPPHPPAPDSEKSSHTPGGHRGPHARMTSALSPEEPVTAICKLNMTNRFPASPPGRRDERWRARGGISASA